MYLFLFLKSFKHFNLLSEYNTFKIETENNNKNEPKQNKNIIFIHLLPKIRVAFIVSRK